MNFSVASTAKSGHMPWGASFAFNNANELPLPLDNRTNDFAAGVAWANRKGMFRLGGDGSFFSNQIQSLTWDNPIGRPTSTMAFCRRMVRTTRNG